MIRTGHHLRLLLRSYLLPAVFLPVQLLVAQPSGAWIYSVPALNATCTWMAPDGQGGWYAEWIPAGQIRVLSHHDQAGTMSWARRFVDGDTVPTVLVDKAITSNGDLIGGFGLGEYSGGSGDSGYVEVRLSRVDPTGEVLWHARARTQFWYVPSWYDIFDITLGPGDEIFAMVGVEDDRNILFKFTPDGQLSWMRWLHPSPLLAASAIVSDGVGGCYIACHLEATNEAMELLHIDGNGSLISSFRYPQAAVNAYLKVKDLCLAPNGDVIVAGANNVVGAHNYFMLMRIAPDGQPVWCNYYLKSGWGMQSWDEAHAVLTSTGIWFHDEVGMIHANEEGEGVAGYDRTTLLAGGTQTDWSIYSIATQPQSDTLWMCGSMAVQDLVLGIARFRPYVASVPPEASCQLTAAVLTTVDAISAISMEPIASTVEPRYVTSSIGGGGSQDIAVWVGEDMCSLVGIEEPVPFTGASVTLMPSVLQCGEPLRVLARGSERVEVLDGTGRLLLTRTLPTTSSELTIDTEDLVPGLYLVRLIDRAGRPAEAARLVVY